MQVKCPIHDSPVWLIEEAYECWLDNQIYVDSNANYRWSKSYLSNLPEGAKSGRVVPFNKLIKSQFENVHDFHTAAHQWLDIVNTIPL